MCIPERMRVIQVGKLCHLFEGFSYGEGGGKTLLISENRMFE